MQSCNRDFTYKIPYKNEILNAKQLSEILNVSRCTITKYAKKGMTGEEIERRLIENGRTKKWGCNII